MNVEVWVDIYGWEGFYQVSSMGRVRTCVAVGGRGNRYVVGHPWRILSLKLKKVGYYELRLRIPTTGKSVWFSVARLVWSSFKGPIPENYTIDHVNRDRQDDRIENLRLATHVQQARNRNKENGKCTSKYKGVGFRKNNTENPWVATTINQGKWVYLGHFKTEIEAAQAYNNYAKENFGEFAKLNEVEDFGVN